MTFHDEELVDEVDELQDLLEVENTEQVLDLVSSAFIGAFVLENAVTGGELHETMLSGMSCSDAAVGDIFLTLSEDYPYANGWRVKSIVVHPMRIGLYQQQI